MSAVNVGEHSSVSHVRCSDTLTNARHTAWNFLLLDNSVSLHPETNYISDSEIYCTLQAKYLNSSWISYLLLSGNRDYMSLNGWIIIDNYLCVKPHFVKHFLQRRIWSPGFGWLQTWNFDLLIQIISLKKRYYFAVCSSYLDKKYILILYTQRSQTYKTRESLK